MSNLVVESMSQFRLDSFPKSHRTEEKENILESGHMDLFFDKLDFCFREAKVHQRVLPAERLEHATIGKLLVLFETLGRVFSMNGAKKTLCEGVLKNGIYTTCKENKLIAAKVINLPSYKHDSRFTEVIEKINYLTKVKFISTLSDGFIFNTKFSHHLGKTLGNFNLAANRGITYFVGGLTACAVGMSNLYPHSPQEPNKVVASFYLVPGACCAISPFVSAALSANTDDP